MSYCIGSADRKVADDLDKRRHDIDGASEPEDQTGSEPREVVVLPYPKCCQRPIYSKRNDRREKPDPRKRFDIVNCPPKRIGQNTGGKAEINPEAPRANTKLELAKEKRTFRKLMADIAKESKNRGCRRAKAEKMKNGRGQDSKKPDARNEERRKPNAPCLCRKTFRIPDRNIRFIDVLHKLQAA